MTMALDLARKGAWTCTPNPQVGCVIVRDGRVVGSGWHCRAGEEHAEVFALREAGAAAKGGTAYVSLEPCFHTGRTSPCVGALLKAGVSKVVVATPDTNPQVRGNGIVALREAGISCDVGVLEREARWINRGFFRRVEDGRPWITLKLATTIDGRIALPHGESKWITSRESRREVHKLRAGSCAILTGSGTALADNPSLTARDVAAPRQPLRVLVDSKGQCPPTLRLFAENAVVVVAKEQDRDYRPGTEVHVGALNGYGQIDLDALVRALAAKWEVNYLLVEAGGGLVGALLAAGLVDEVVAFVAPRFLGAGVSVAQFAGVSSLADTLTFEIREVGKVGPDCRIKLVRI